MFRTILTGFTSFILLSTAPAVAASPITEVICGAKAEMRAKLSDHFGAVQTATGIRSPEAVLEIWTNPTSGDWTLVQTYTEDRSCILAMGQFWEYAPPRAAAADPNAG